MMTVSEIADQTGYVLSGDPQMTVHGIAYSNTAGKGDIAVVFSKKDIETTNSDIVLSKPCPDFSEKTFIFTHESIDLAMVRVAQVLIQKGMYPDYSRVSSKLEPISGCFLDHTSIIGELSQLGPGCVIHENVSIGKRCSIGAHTEILPGTVIEDDVHIGSGCSIGANALFRIVSRKQGLFCGIGKVRIHRCVSIGNGVTIQRGVLSDTTIGENTIIGNMIDIAHDVTIGTDCFIVSQTGIAGNAFIGNYVTVFGQSGIANRVRIGNHVTIFGQSFVTKNINDFQRVSGSPAHDHKKEMACLARMRRNLKTE